MSTLETPSATHLLSPSAQHDQPLLYNAICKELQGYIDAEQFHPCFTQSLALVRDFPKVELFRLFLGVSARRIGESDVAVAALLAVLKDNPKQTTALFELGMAYHRLNRYEECLSCLEQSFAIDAQATTAKNLSVIYYEYGQFDKAMYYCEQTIALDTKQEQQYGPALIQLALGDYANGWASYEYRLQKTGPHISPLKLPTPRWDGKTDLTGKTLLITWEQGYGDNIQFVRFVSKLQAFHPTTIYMLCPIVIAPLFSQIEGLKVLPVDFSTGFDIPAHDYQISLPSLPYVLNIIDEAQFFTEPYLHADSIKQETMRNAKYHGGWLQVGICWAGATQHIFNDARSCSLDFFIPLLAYRQVRWLSLQKEPSKDESQILDLSHIANLNDMCKDFADTAAAIALLDLVICVDTAIAHLAGAMGKPVWLLARYQTEWRHPRGRDTSPWYPTMRIMRQAKPGDWDSVRQQVETALEEQYHLTKLEGT